jgi:hypothetical protein
VIGPGRPKYSSSSIAHLGVVRKLVGGNVVDGEVELDTLGLGLLDELGDLLRTSLVEQRLADLPQSAT